MTTTPPTVGGVVRHVPHFMLHVATGDKNLPHTPYIVHIENRGRGNETRVNPLMLFWKGELSLRSGFSLSPNFRPITVHGCVQRLVQKCG
jgi:hypothetical protein